MNCPICDGEMTAWVARESSEKDHCSCDNPNCAIFDYDFYQSAVEKIRSKFATQAAEIARLQEQLIHAYTDAIDLGISAINNPAPFEIKGVSAESKKACIETLTFLKLRWQEKNALLRPQPQPAQAEPETPVLSSEIKFAEVTTDETGTYLAIWKDDVHHSFLIEDVFEAMTSKSGN